MKTIKDKTYSFNHTQKRLKVRHNIDITREEYDNLCYVIKNIKDEPVHIEKKQDDVQKIYEIVFKNKEIICVWSEKRQLITTALVYYNGD